VGTNRRYPDLAEKRAQERELRQARERGPLQSLTDDQLRLHRETVSIPPERPGLWAWAWLRFGLDGHVRCKVRIARWTESAVGVELRLYDDEVLRCWVWRGAVEVADDPD
jgi:hypothetical protein